MKVNFTVELDYIDEDGTVSKELKESIIKGVSDTISFHLSNNNFINHVAQQVTNDIKGRVTSKMVPIVIAQVEKVFGDDKAIHNAAILVMQQSLSRKLKG